ADFNGDGNLDAATTNVNDNTVSVLLNQTPTGPVATLVELFRAGATSEGIEIEWSLSDPTVRVVLERGESPVGGFEPVVASPRQEGFRTIVIDSAARSDRSWWYRLTRSDDNSVLTEPI